jgi:isoleucyl-tRNA synthetase
MNLVEELSDFNEWCISEMGHWGTPVPYFVNSKTGDFLLNEEISRHVA